jgi:peptidoglycan/LPS O-acetylase OafA/YrhL
MLMSTESSAATSRHPVTRTARRPWREIRALTGLRAAAASWVLLFHFEPELRPYVDQLPGAHAVLTAAWIGVELFFVLSGFVIARRFLEECGRRWSTAGAARFVLNRFARVWLAWMAVTVVACAWLVVCPRLGLDANTVSGHPPLELTTLLRQVTMTQMWGESSLIDVSYVAPGWSISAEWLAYLAFPLLALALRPFLGVHPAVNLVLATAAMSPLALTSFLHGTDDIEMNWVLRIACSFVAGVLASCAVADLEHSERGERWGQRLTAAGLGTAGVVLLWANWAPRPGPRRRRGDRQVRGRDGAVLAAAHRRAGADRPRAGAVPLPRHHGLRRPDLLLPLPRALGRAGRRHGRALA